MEESFKSFLENVVNLNPTRYDRAVSSVDTITKILKNSPVFGANFVSLKPQGSFRQETIIKPVNPDDDFDVDLLFEMKAVSEWQPEDYLNRLSAEFKKIDTYKNKVDTRSKTRCITIDYDIDFHIDIVPAISLPSGEMIMNKKTNSYEITDGDGYAQWFEKQNKITNGNLKRVVRLMKYIRDSKKDFEIKSILLTTLIGHQVLSIDIPDRDYRDTSTSFITLIKKLDSFLQLNPTMPVISNPVLQSENFNRRWDQNKYEKFRNKINECAKLITDIYQTKDISRWQKIFGDKFGTEVKNESPSRTENPINDIALGDYSHKKELSEEGITDRGIYPYKVNIRAHLYFKGPKDKEINRRPKGTVAPNSLIPVWHEIDYIAETNAPYPYRVYWQVVNTGGHAKREGGLRGEIFNWPLKRTEHTLYTGKHWIECFIVSEDNVCIARSGPFYVKFLNSLFPVKIH